MKSFRQFAILCVLPLCLAAASQAQQAPGTVGDAPAAPSDAQKPEVPQAPPVVEPKAPEPRRAPATLEEMVRGQRDERWERERGVLRQSLEEAGLGDKALQDAVVDFASLQDVAREELRRVSARCWDALRDPDVKDAQLSVLLKSYQDAAATAQDARDKALAELDAKVHFTNNARLQMLLRLKGLLGSEAWLAGDALGEPDSFDLRTLYPPAQ